LGVVQGEKFGMCGKNAAKVGEEAPDFKAERGRGQFNTKNQKSWSNRGKGGVSKKIRAPD